MAYTKETIASGNVYTNESGASATYTKETVNTTLYYQDEKEVGYGWGDYGAGVYGEERKYPGVATTYSNEVLLNNIYTPVD